MTTHPIEPANIRILCIDDEQGILDLLSFELSNHGYQVETALDGEEGLNKLRNGGKFHLVISDIKMPRLSGLETLLMIKRIDPEIEVIMTTGFGTADMGIESIKNGAYDFITKPYNLDELLSRIQKALEKQSLVHEIASLKEHLRLASEVTGQGAHELHTSLSAIIQEAGCLLKDTAPPLSENQASVIKHIIANANHLLVLIKTSQDSAK